MLQSILDSATEVLWGRGTIALTLLCGFYFTVCTGFLPITRLTTVLQKTIGSVFSFHSDRENGKGVSPFAAVSTALRSEERRVGKECRSRCGSSFAAGRRR